jgi:hypothetical protein
MPNVITTHVTETLAPAAEPRHRDGIVVTHEVTWRNWRQTGLEEQPRWRLRVTVTNVTTQTDEPWTFAPLYVLEEHDVDHEAPVCRRPGCWVVRYSYGSHDQALAQLERLANKR